MNNDYTIGCGLILFGILVGGVGIATAGIGIGIPIIPIGVYFIFRGYSRARERSLARDSLAYEKSWRGKVGLGIILIFAAAATSAFLVGIPIMGFGVYLIYQGIWGQRSV